MQHHLLFHVVILLSILILPGCFTAGTSADPAEAARLPDWLDSHETVAEPESNDTDLYGNIELPYPQRQNPFAIGTRADVSSGSAVQLKGFVHVSEPKAILLVNDVLTVVAPDQTAQGVTVVAIAPPEVVYKQAGIEHRLSLLTK